MRRTELDDVMRRIGWSLAWILWSIGMIVLLALCLQ